MVKALKIKEIRFHFIYCDNKENHHYYYYNFFTLSIVFHPSSSWIFFTGVWMIESLLKSPGLSSVFWLIYIAIVWMVSIRPLISKSSSLLSQFFVDCTEHSNYNWYHRHLHIPLFFNSLSRSTYLSLFSLSFSFTLWSTRTAKSTIQQVLFFVDFYKVWSPGRD